MGLAKLDQSRKLMDNEIPPKQRLQDLAIMGGEPAFERELHVGYPSLGDQTRLRQRIDDILASRRLTNHGPYVREFERRIADYLEVKHCVAVCNGTAALEIVVRALGLSGQVIVPSFTFIATVHALQWQGLTPVFCDIDPATFTLDPGRVEDLVGPQTTAILGVHLWGRSCQIDALEELAQRHGLALVFDAAQAFACTYKGTWIGSYGKAEIFSFHATKTLSTFEGGAVLTNDDALAHKVRLMQNFGFAGYDEVVAIGINGKMKEIEAAMGLTSLESLGSSVEDNERKYECYRVALKGIPGVRLHPYSERERTNFQYITALVDRETAQLHRDQLLKVLHAERVLARRYFYPGCHRMEPYRSRSHGTNASLPVTERVCEQVLVLPTGASLSEDAVHLIGQIIRLSVENADQVRGFRF